MSIYIRKHIALLVSALLFSGSLFAQDSSALFVLDAEDLAIANVQNLEEALINVPGIHHYIQDGQSQTTFGTLSAGQIAIFKNDVPLAMDQNVGFNLRAIPVWDIERIEIHVAAVSNLVKNSSTIVIKLYTKEFERKSIWSSASLMTTSANDLSTSLEVGISNIKHNLNVGVNRSFQSAIYETEDVRSTLWGGEERLDLNVRYRYRIFGSVVLDVQSDNSVLSTRNKGRVIPNTTRVRDLNSSFRNHSLSSSFFAPISKNHSMRLSGRIHRFTNAHVLLDKDLNTGEAQENQVIEKTLNTGYDYGYMRLELSSNNRRLNYNAGLELSNTHDNTFSSVNAIATEYSDYAAFTNFQYQQKNTVLLKGGAKLLVHSLSGSHFLPYGSVVIAPSSIIQLTGSYIRSLSYPMFNTIFYTTEMNKGVAGNIQLDPIKQNTISVNLKIGQKNLTAQSGLLYVQSNNVIRQSVQSKFENLGRSSTTSLYTVLQYTDKIWNVRPHVVLQSNNFIRDRLGISFVHPQLGITAKATIPKLKTTIGLILRNDGVNTVLERKEDVIYQTDIRPIRRLSLYIKQPLLKDKLALAFGVNNWNNNTTVESNTYRLETLDRILQDSTQVLAARSKAFVINVTYEL